MIWSVLAGRIPLGAIASVAARAAHLPTFSVVARRTLFATSQLDFPTAKTSSKKSTRQTSEKKASKGKVTAKRGRPPKNVAKHEKKQLKPVKQRTRIPENLKPPKRAPSPYILFYSSFVKSQPKQTTLQEIQGLAKSAAEIWKGYSMAEKQPFYDESEVRKARAKQEREEFFRNTSTSELKQLNAIRKAQNKPKYHSTNKSSAPVSPFIQFSNEFRNSSDGQALINETSPEKRYPIRAVIAAANRWNSMSTEEKAPYFERFRQAKEELKAEAP